MMVIADGSFKRRPLVVLKLLFSVSEELVINNLLVIRPIKNVNEEGDEWM